MKSMSKCVFKRLQNIEVRVRAPLQPNEEKTSAFGYIIIISAQKVVVCAEIINVLAINIDMLTFELVMAAGSIYSIYV